MMTSGEFSIPDLGTFTPDSGLFQLEACSDGIHRIQAVLMDLDGWMAHLPLMQEVYSIINCQLCSIISFESVNTPSAMAGPSPWRCLRIGASVDGCER
jgi:hypothetical protein